MIRADLRTRLLDAVNDAGAVFTTATQANALLNEALEVLAEEVDAVKRTAYLPLQPGTTYYHLAAIAPDVMAPWRVWLMGDHRRLRPVTMRELDDRHVLWQQTTGEPYCWFPLSWDWFGIWPKSSAGGNVLRVDYLAWPASLAYDDDAPELLEHDTDALIQYGVYQTAAKRWDEKRAVEEWATFKQMAGITKGRTNVRPGSEAFARSAAIRWSSGVRG